MHLRVVGILNETGGPDDRGVFTDIKTTWVIEGVGHGHQKFKEGEIESDRPAKISSQVSNKQRPIIEAGAALVTDQTITSTNQKRFHFHGDKGQFPISAVLIYPSNDRSASLVKARSKKQSHWQISVPKTIIAELLSLIFKIESLINALSRGILLITLGLGTLVIWLSVQLRAREWRSLSLLGVSKRQLVTLAGFEIGLLLFGASVMCLVLLWTLFALERLLFVQLLTSWLSL